MGDYGGCGCNVYCGEECDDYVSCTCLCDVVVLLAKME